MYKYLKLKEHQKDLQPFLLVVWLVHRGPTQMMRFITLLVELLIKI